TIETHFGFDTFGLREFFTPRLKNGDANPLYHNGAAIFDGFYTTNHQNADGSGPVVPQALIDARVTVGGGVDILVASATVNGGIYTHGPTSNPFTLTATLCDDHQVAEDDNPSKLRFRDVFTPLPSFDMHGDFRAGIFAEVTIGRWPLKHT